jgi:serine/threonine-protein kinase
VKRFKIEAQSVASLSHPNVVSIYDVGYQDDIHYIVMEYVDGLTLKEYINKHGALNWQDAIKITIQICSAIEHAHKNNIVHRDIKPHNILMTRDGIAKVTDFGIARAVTSSTITMVGSTIGSVHYFSPEQARGGFIDEKSDLYSLGIAMYEMVVGKVPFDGDTPVAVALKHIQEIPAEPRKLAPSLPYGVNEIIMKAIQKDQTIRYQSATAMINDLNKVLVQPQGGFIGQELVKNQATMRMQAVNASNIANSARRNASTNNQHEVAKQKKKNTAAYWLAGITSILVIAIALIITISLINKANAVTTYQLENYKGQKIDVIKPSLEAKGFKITEVWQDNESIAKGIILDQNIPAGTSYKKGNFTDLELTISNGPKMSLVPDVKNRDYREAQNDIQTASLIPKLEYEFNKDIPADFVIRTEPLAGKQVKEGTDVIIYVSKGTEIKKVKVPNLVGKTELEAQQLLADSKLVLGNILPVGTTKGIVNRQLPDADSPVDEGYAVTIFLTPQEVVAPPTTPSQDGAATSTVPADGGTPPATSTVPATTSTETPVIP